MNSAEKLLNAFTRHAVDMERYSTGIIRRIIKLVARAEADIVAQVTKDLRGLNENGFDLNPEENRQIRALQRRLQEINRAAHAEILKRLTSDAVDMGMAEAEFTSKVYTLDEGIVAELGVPSAPRIKAIVTSQPFQGRVLRDWAAALEAGMLRRVKDAINLGLVQGESTGQIVTRIRGTKAYNYTDGVMKITERGAEGLVRTVSSHVQSRVHEETLSLSPEIFKGLQWASVLDRRTSAICRSRDGNVYPIGKGPRPPAHWGGCRSRMIGLLKHGPNAKLKTYDEWLREQPRHIVEDIMGKAKAKLYLEGNVPLKGFVSRAGEELTLEELRARDAGLFKELGL